MNQGRGEGWQNTNENKWEKRKKINKRTNVDEQQHKGKKYHFRNGGGGGRRIRFWGKIKTLFPL